MSEENKEKETVTVSKEEFEALKQEHTKLKTIFDERQTKVLKKEDVLKKEEILKALGIEKDPDVDPIAELTKIVTGLQTDLTKEREALETVKKRSEAEKVASELGFIDADDALVGIDLNGDIEAQIKARAEKKPHLLKKDDVGGNFKGSQKSTTKDEELEAQLKALGILK